MDPKERRASLRQPIKLAAQLVMAADQAWPCQIADFCAEGLFLRYSADTARKLEQRLARTGQDEFQVRFRSPDGRTRHELDVRIARRLDNAMGVMFTRSNPAAVNAMLIQCGADRGQERSALKAPSDRVQFVLHQCAKTVVQHIEPLMDACFTRMVADLQEAAQRAGSDQQANDLMDTAGQVPARQRAIWNQMIQALESPLKPARKGAPGAELSLVDKGEFEDWLTIKVMVTKADTLYRHDLLQLKMRFDKLAVSNATGHQNPLGPALVCEAFHLGLQQLKAGRQAEKICLRAFEVTVLQELGSLYNALNEILIRHGVLPDLDLSKYLSEKTPSPETPKANSRNGKAAAGPSAGGRSGGPQSATAAPADDPFSPAPEPAPARRAQGLAAGQASASTSAGFRNYSRAAQSAFATVRNLIGTLSASRLAAGDKEPVVFSPHARPLSAGEFQRELQQLQVQVPEAGAEPAPLRERVVEKVKAGGEVALDEEQQGTLDVVDRFFRSVVESPKLSESAQQQLRQLEVPVLKVVLRDRAFFDDQSSPVRGVMNRLAQLGVKGGRTNPVIQRRIDELVQRITTEFEQDTRVFETAVTELDSLIDRQNLVYRRNVERVTAAAEGSQKVAESKTAVAEALDQRLAGRKVPRVVVSLLNGGWRDLLSLTWIRQGPESPLWQDYLSVVDSLLALGDDPTSAINLPELLRVIQDGLASISSNHMPSSQIRDELKQFLVRKPDAQVDLVDIPAPPKPEVAEQKESKQAERERRSLQRWINRAQKLRTGDWMCDQEKPDQPQYIRVVWIARGFSRFVFVNHQGMRVVELELEALARQMQKGLIVQDTQYDRPLVDESIDRMVKKVYDQLSWASTHDELTGLLARREFERMLEQQLARHEDERFLVRLDLRQFRLLNDTAGYSAGDDTLKQVAGILQAEVGEGMPLARLGGNEFGFLVPAEEGEAVTERIIKAVEALKPTFAGKQYQLSASAGVAAALPALATAERWLRAAEEACKLAKKRGNGQLSYYSLDAQGHALQEQIAAKVAGLGNLDEERMLLRCQKIIPLHPDAAMTTQYEVLISMYDDSGNLITAAEFVRMAERYNRMQAVDRWVVGHMLDWLRESSPGQAHVGGICINLSGYSLNDESLLEFIYDKLSQKDAPIERLWFEITEAAAINNLQGVAEFIEEMKELGCRFCLGNFGSGPTSYQYMRSLPVDLVKLDGAFVQQVAKSETDHAMVRSMVEMAHYMKREVIASQVESREALEALRLLGVDYAQGYVIEKPRLLSSLT
ncbi:MAG: DUF1631 family protein [Marinobacter sp.]|uniref:DUF1631 family protein n=1 Tax=Marinobacter sp. TaxID=50741 RepID=UPI00299E6FCF|nr:DUF1631 family protein [Marinobacter sp.]MDX1633546.1 DUF1631 family protein [Marinobacter sp.]